MKGAVRAHAAQLAFALGLAATPAAAGADTLVLSELGQGPVAVTGAGNAELSGITWLGEGRFLSVDDGGKSLLPLEVTLDAATGAILTIATGTAVPLSGAQDLEGIAQWPGHDGVLVVDEGTRDLREYEPTSGKLQKRIDPPAMFDGRVKKNAGLESIAATPDGKSVWFATEGPLRRDGRGPNAMSGGWVRLQRLDADLAPAGQYAYRTEPGLGFVGVVDLLATPQGELLVLERALTGGGFSARIFHIDVAQATDVSSFEKLRNREDFRPVGKVKLWERSGGFHNFEGMALGPELAIGGRLVVLVSDGGGQQAPTLLALRLTRRPTPAASPPLEAPTPGDEGD
jgi:hypothetical protein